MSPDRAELFDQWAETYDRSIPAADLAFPFAGYEDVLAAIVRLAEPLPTMTVVDVGTGTGNLAARFVSSGCSVLGIDFSVEMLKRAGEKLPLIQLAQVDLRQFAWPATFPEQVDRVVSSYVFHEFDLDTKLRLLHQLASRLATDGHMVIGDIAFPDGQIFECAHQRWAKRWDEEEWYWTADETIRVCQSIGLAAQYQQVSSCGGVFVFQVVAG